MIMIKQFSRMRMREHEVLISGLEDKRVTAVFQVLAMQSVMRYTSMYVRSCSTVDFQRQLLTHRTSRMPTHTTRQPQNITGVFKELRILTHY